MSTSNVAVAATPEESPLAGWKLLFRPKTYLRFDILATVILIPVTIALCFFWGFNPNFDIGSYAFAGAMLFLFSTVPTFVFFMIRGMIIIAPAAPVERRLCFASMIINTVVLVSMSWIYAHLKAGVLLGASYDVQLRDLERMFLGGAEGWSTMRSVFSDDWGLFFTVVYWMFKPLILGTILWLILACKTSKANQLTCAIVLGYYIGVFAYHIVPSYGPCYLNRDACPVDSSPRTASVQQLLLWHTQDVQLNPETTVIVPWKYIGAFPSLHLSHVLILTWFMRNSRFGLVFYSLFSFLTALSTIYLGWHYIIDLFGGFAVAATAICITEWSKAYVPFGLEEHEPAQAATPEATPELAPVPAYMEPAFIRPEACAMEAQA